MHAQAFFFFFFLTILILIYLRHFTDPTSCMRKHTNPTDQLTADAPSCLPG